MNSKSKYGILLLSSILVIYAIVGGMLHRVSAQDGSFEQLHTFTEVVAKIQSDYVDEPNMANVYAGAIRGLIEQVDPNGGYLSSKDIAFYKSFSPLKTAGIGAILERTRNGYPMVLSVFPGGAADKAGLVSGDMLEAIDGITTREMNIVQVNGFLANPPDKPASLIVVRRETGEPEMMTVNREIAKLPPVESKMIETDIAYVRVRYLATGKAAEVRKQLDDLLKKGAKSVILDLRSNSGGEEQEGVAVANLFLDSGTVGYLQKQKSEKQILPVDPKAFLTKLPLVVLVDQGTAGPAEIVAGAIRDNNRGQLVGTRTFGDAVVRSLISMEGGNALLISVAKYYTPTGKEIEEEGVRPQLEIAAEAPETLDLSSDTDQIVAPKPATAPQEDRQLNKAIEVLKPKAPKNA